MMVRAPLPFHSNSAEQGATMKLSDEELTTAYNTLVNVAATLEADCRLIHKKSHIDGGLMGTVMMRTRADAVEALEIRVACITLPLSSM
jgi:hypothetical protein